MQKLIQWIFHEASFSDFREIYPHENVNVYGAKSIGTISAAQALVWTLPQVTPTHNALFQRPFTSEIDMNNGKNEISCPLASLCGEEFNEKITVVAMSLK